MPLNLAMIAAMDRNLVIGDGKAMPWHLPADLRYFKKKTQNKIVLMGRKTHESIGFALPNRLNIVISRQAQSQASVNEVVAKYEDQPTQLLWCRSIAHALLLSEGILASLSSQLSSEVMVMGGGQIYSLMMPYVRRMYITRVDTQAAGTVTFPQFELAQWQRISAEHYAPDSDNLYACDFEVYERKVKERPYSELINGESEDVQTMV